MNRNVNEGRIWIFSLGLCFFAACLLPAAFCEEGALKGSIKYDGDPPAVEKHKIPADKQKECSCESVEPDALVVDPATKGIKWAVVRVMDVKAPSEYPAPPKTPEITQHGCCFSPHVLIVPPESGVNFLNPDKVGHNVHTTPYDAANPSKNIMQAADTESLPYKGKWLTQPEIIQVECNIHGWMKGFIVVHDPRYAAVTSADGTFEIKGLPPGKYKVSIFQEACGEKEVEAEVKAGTTADLGEIKMKSGKK